MKNKTSVPLGFVYGVHADPWGDKPPIVAEIPVLQRGEVEIKVLACRATSHRRRVSVRQFYASPEKAIDAWRKQQLDRARQLEDEAIQIRRMLATAERDGVLTVRQTRT